MIINIIIFILASFYDLYISCKVYKYLSNTNKKIMIIDYIVITLFSILIVFNNLYNIALFRPISGMIIILLTYKSVFREENNQNILIIGIVINIVSIIIDFCLPIVVTKYISNLMALNQNILFKFYFSMVYGLLIYLVFKIKYFKKLIYKLLKNLKFSNNLLFYIAISIFSINIIGVIYSTDYSDIKYYILTVTFILFIIITSYLYSKKILIEQSLKIKNSYLEKSINNYALVVDECRIIKHNLLNDLTLLKCLENKEEIIDNLITKYSKSSNEINNTNNIPPGIQGILYIKNNIAENNNIRILFENKTNSLTKLERNRNYYNLCEIVEICLDNAIEASINVNEKNIFVSIEKNQDDIIKFKIINNFSNEINLDKLGEKNYSTKNRNTGLGLYYIYNLNKNIKIVNKIINNVFITTISLKIK